jgi:hypothetical protein
MQEAIHAKKTYHNLLVGIKKNLKINYLKIGCLAEAGWPIGRDCIENLDYYKYIKSNLSTSEGAVSQEMIDVIIPATDKDSKILPYTIDGIFKYIRHPINKVIVISPYSREILHICSQKNCQFIHEDSILPLTRKDIPYEVNGLDRSGWLFQQLLKLAADSLSQAKYYLILDADTVLIRPQVFEIDGKVVFLHSDEHHQPYFDLYYKLFSRKTKSNLSFVCHHMLFEKNKICELKKEIEIRYPGNRWYEILLSQIDRSNASSMSEYELYGQWMLQNYSEKIIREYWFNRGFAVKMLKDIDVLIEELSTEYRSLSFHSYLD